MSSALPIAQGEASKVPAENCNELPKPAIALVAVAGSCKWFTGLANFLSPKKPAPTIHFLTGEPERTCYEWVRGKFDPPSRVLVKLLHTDQGWRVLEYLMRGCKQAWWREIVRARQCVRAFDNADEQFELEFQ